MKFPGLNGLRFFAAFAVLIHHIGHEKIAHGLQSEFLGDTQNLLGSLGVTFFFVLSGFLITNLICTEIIKTGQINLKRFYIRRALRILPLYYLVVLVSFFVFPSTPIFIKNNSTHFFPEPLLLFLALSAQYSYQFFSAIPGAAHLWSTGVEEHFYFFWPLLIRRLKNIQKNLPVMLLTIVIGVLSLHLYTKFYLGYDTDLSRMLGLFRIECMSIGGFGAWFASEQARTGL